MTSDLQYPIGVYEPMPFSASLNESWLKDIQSLPRLTEYAIENLDEAQLDTPYREQGWTVKQLIHHMADSHINAYCRFKLGLTEANPTIKPYEEKLLARLDDVEKVPINISITLLHALHARWYAMIKDLPDESWNRTVVHPEHGKVLSLWYLLGDYAWHGKHHVAHITNLRKRNGW